MISYHVFSQVQPVPTSSLVGMQLSFQAYALSGAIESAAAFRAAWPWML